MLHLSVSTRIAVDEPSTDGGFITWFDILIHRDAPVEMDDERVEQIGRARLAIVHVGALFESDDSLYDVLDADSGDLEALYHLYFDEEQDWFKDELGCAAGVDLGYLQALTLDPAWQGRNIELAVVQRLNATIAAGCKVLVIPVSSPDERARWEQIGFEASGLEGGEPDHVHLNNATTHPRVVPAEHPRSIPAPHEEDRFKVLSDEDEDDDEEVESAGGPAPAPQPTLHASPGRTYGAVARRAIASRRPARRRQ
jgi:hypothetical protein